LINSKNKKNNGHVRTSVPITGFLSKCQPFKRPSKCNFVHRLIRFLLKGPWRFHVEGWGQRRSALGSATIGLRKITYISNSCGQRRLCPGSWNERKRDAGGGCVYSQYHQTAKKLLTVIMSIHCQRVKTPTRQNGPSIPHVAGTRNEEQSGPAIISFSDASCRCWRFPMISKCESLIVLKCFPNPVACIVDKSLSSLSYDSTNQLIGRWK
jgi:hypothetical protein